MMLKVGIAFKSGFQLGQDWRPAGFRQVLVHQSTIGVEKAFRFQVDVAQHVFNAIAWLVVSVGNFTIAADMYRHRMGITKQVVHITEDFLIGTDQKQSDQVGPIGVPGGYWQRGFYSKTIDVLINGAV